MSGFEAEYSTYCDSHGAPDRLELMLCDLNAILRGKWLPGDATGKLANGGVRLPISTYAPNILGQEVQATGLGIVAGDPDGVLQPVPGSLRPVPWAKGNIAQVQVEMVDGDGRINALSPREILGNVLARFQAKGLKPVVATELEFYVLKPRRHAGDPPEPPDRATGAQNYDLEVLARHEALLTDIQAAATAQGLATDTLIAEYGPGQFEVNFHHTDDVLAAADTALLFRRLVRGVAAQHGLEATFMAKPYGDHPGNGMHVHASLVDAGGQNILAAKTGVSGPMKAAVAGVLSTMREMQAVFAPHLNSYRRFQPESFAPSAPDWGFDHRGAAVRLPETSGPGARLEHRICGADVNPYLALAAVLGGMLHGMDAQPPLPPPLDDPKAEPAQPLSHDWTTAVDRLAASDFAADILGETYRDLYVTVRRDEISALCSIVAPVEYSAYLGRL